MNYDKYCMLCEMCEACKEMEPSARECAICGTKQDIQEYETEVLEYIPKLKEKENETISISTNRT